MHDFRPIPRVVRCDHRIPEQVGHAAPHSHGLRETGIVVSPRRHPLHGIGSCSSHSDANRRRRAMPRLKMRHGKNMKMRPMGSSKAAQPWRTPWTSSAGTTTKAARTSASPNGIPGACIWPIMKVAAASPGKLQEKVKGRAYRQSCGLAGQAVWRTVAPMRTSVQVSALVSALAILQLKLQLIITARNLT